MGSSRYVRRSGRGLRPPLAESDIHKYRDLPRQITLKYCVTHDRLNIKKYHYPYPPTPNTEPDADPGPNTNPNP